MDIWDKIADKTKKDKEAEDTYLFWLRFAKRNYGIISLEERSAIYEWCEYTPGSDLNGRIRGTIIMNLHNADLRSFINLHDIKIENVPIVVRKAITYRVDKLLG